MSNIKTFKMFLRNRTLLNRFELEIQKTWKNTTVSEVYKMLRMPQKYLTQAFDWSKSVDGREFWVKVNDEWQKELLDIASKTPADYR